MATTVKMLVRIAGLRDGLVWPGVGEAISLPDAEAEDMIRNGYATALEPAVEAATLPADGVETAATSTAPKARKPRSATAKRGG